MLIYLTYYLPNLLIVGYPISLLLQPTINLLNSILFLA